MNLLNLSLFNTNTLFEAATNLFQQLGIKLNSNTAEALPTKDLLKSFYKDNEVFNSIKNTYFIGIIDDSVFQATGMFDVNYSIKEALQQGDKKYDGLMLFALELTKKPTRTEISKITRAFNRISQKMPVALVLKYSIETEAVISIAISERFKYLQNWRQGEKVGKVIILRDIHTQHTHAGHTRILRDLIKPGNVTNYEQLHKYWLEVLDVNILNKKFYHDLANWYFWAMDKIQFPDDIEKNKDVRNATNLIRLITRIIFIWFLKEKNLIPDNLFDKDYLSKILKDFQKNKKSSNYYQAILQNLFFGTLNQKMDERDFAEDHNRTNKLDQGIKNKYRYPDKFNISKKEIITLFEGIPFLNGGLFDCLDKFDEEKLEKGKKDQVFIDGFTRIKEKQAIVPDYLFFGDDINEDLTKYYDPEAKKPIVKNVKGLINILNGYKFTVAENTPLEEEIALDPELLGKVFENLLASYNPETKTTARKQTGSFYTPREIVNYMVDESLIEYLKQNTEIKTDDFDNRLRNLFSYNEEGNPFKPKETDELIEAINNAKILDPACGSGAFPMGVLHKMVYLLQKLDPGNVKWKAQQKEKIIGNQIKELEKDKKAIAGLSDKAVREKAIQAVDERLKEIDEIFESKNNFDDYARKLYLIENCIYGIDIQPIAVQISKLRFFISLIIDQDKDSKKENLGFRSLPNLETKFVAANTLISLEIPTTNLFSENNPIKVLQEELKATRHEYFNAKTRKDKLRLQQQDKALRKKIAAQISDTLIHKKEEEIANLEKQFAEAKKKLTQIENEPEQKETIESTNIFGETETTVIDKKKEKIKAQKSTISTIEKQINSLKATGNKDAILRVAQQISSFDPYDQNHFANWFEPEWMFGNEVKDGFDIVIGNPPYIQLQKDGGKLAKLFENKGFSTFERTGDIYSLFYEKGIQLLMQNGLLAFITSNKWMRAGYGKSTRAFFCKHNPLKLIDLGSGVFESATVDTNILLIQKNAQKPDQYHLKALDLTKQKKINSFDDFNKQWVTIKQLSDDAWAISNDIEQRIKQKIEQKGIPLKDWDVNIYYGIKTGLNEAFIITTEKRNEILANCKDEDERQRTEEIIKPILRGRDIKRYHYEWAGLWVIGTFPALKLTIDDYPALKKYLLDNFDIRQLEQSGKKYPELGFDARKKTGNQWFETQDQIAYYPEFEKEKIVWNRIASIKEFSLVEKGVLIQDSMHFIVGKSLLFFVTILNSKLFSWLLNLIIGTAAGGNAGNADNVKNIPIPKLSEEEQKPFVALVEQILEKKERNEDTTALEQEIDNLVYKLYELTYEEVKVIDPAFTLSREEYESFTLQ